MGKAGSGEESVRFRSTFSGIEAASSAWLPLGWECEAVSEVDPFACHVLAHRHGASRPLFMPQPADTDSVEDAKAKLAAIRAVSKLPERGKIQNLGDVTRYKEWPDATFDLLVGGSPCQSFSVAGLRKGLDDPRGNLMFSYLGIAERYRPKWLVWENVPGVLSIDGGRAFGSFLGGLAELRYGFAYAVLDAQFFGVPQRRRRVFVVGYLGDWRRAAAVLFDRESLSGDPAPRRETGEGIAGSLAARTRGGGGLGTDFEASGGVVEVAQTLRNHPRPGSNSIGNLALRTVAHAVACHSAKGGDPTTDNYVVAHTLRCHGFDACKASGRNRFGVGDQSPALRAMGSRVNHNNAGGQVAVHDRMQVRRITPREAERLQGFPDDWTLIPYGGKPAADGPRYRGLGNSMAVPVMAFIGRRIDLVEALDADRS